MTTYKVSVSPARPKERVSGNMSMEEFNSFCAQTKTVGGMSWQEVENFLFLMGADVDLFVSARPRIVGATTADNVVGDKRVTVAGDTK